MTVNNSAAICLVFTGSNFSFGAPKFVLMNIRSLFMRFLLVASLALPALSLSLAQPADTNQPPAALEQPAAPVAALDAETLAKLAAMEMSAAELAELRAKVEGLKAANEEVIEKWSVQLVQNQALSNVLGNLEKSLEEQRRREIELSEQSRAFNAKVLTGAGAAVFLVFLGSYWFQFRCLNRVMEITQPRGELPVSFGPALLEAATARESKLLDAVRILEDRIRHLESPGSANGAHENGHAVIAENSTEEPAAVASPNSADAPLATKVSVLLAKGDVLLETERLQEALTTFSEAVNYAPTNVETHLKKGIALERLNRLEQALSCYNDALRLNPKRSFAYVHKARVLAALQRYDEALSVYDMALGKPAKSNSVEEPVRMFKDAVV